MYTATKKEIIKFMREVDMSSPHSLSGLINIMRDEHNRYWFDEGKVLGVLKHLNAETVMIAGRPYYRIIPPIMDMYRESHSVSSVLQCS